MHMLRLRAKKTLVLYVVCVLVVAFSAPLFAEARPFGGRASLVKPCYNKAIFTRLGAPRGGSIIWSKSTRTYQFGPPKRAGQWFLGLTSGPYYCIISIKPLIVLKGEKMMINGSSK